MNIVQRNSPTDWNDGLLRLPAAHILQSWEWGELKSRYGWSVERRFWERNGVPAAAAQILHREMHLGPISASVIYVPRGPLLDWADEETRGAVLGALEQTARERKAIQVKIDPGLAIGWGIPGAPDDAPDALGVETQSILQSRGWRFSPEQVQFRNTMMLDLAPSEEELLAAMKQKTRYNIRLAEKHGVRVRAGTAGDLPLLYRMYAETAHRDGFVIRAEEYYQAVWGALLQSGKALPLIAEVEELPVAAIVVFVFGGEGIYMHGMSRNLHREKMPNHLLQWEAIRRLRALGCGRYDLWGAPDDFRGGDHLQGVMAFKQGFGARVVRQIGAWDFAPSPARYALYHGVLPRLLDITRAAARRRTRTVAEAA